MTPDWSPAVNRSEWIHTLVRILFGGFWLKIVPLLDEASRVTPTLL